MQESSWQFPGLRLPTSFLRCIEIELEGASQLPEVSSWGNAKNMTKTLSKLEIGKDDLNIVKDMY